MCTRAVENLELAFIFACAFQEYVVRGKHSSA